MPPDTAVPLPASCYPTHSCLHIHIELVMCCVQNTAADVRRTLENPETINRHIKIQPGINVIVLEDLNVPSSTVNTVNCRLATLDLRKSGLDASQFASIFNCIVILPSQVRPAESGCVTVAPVRTPDASAVVDS